MNETIQDPQPDSISLPVAEFVQRMVDVVAGLSSRVIALERQHAEDRLERDALERRLTLLLRAQQDEIELLGRLNSEAFAKIALTLAKMADDRGLLPPPNSEVN